MHILMHLAMYGILLVALTVGIIGIAESMHD